MRSEEESQGVGPAKTASEGPGSTPTRIARHWNLLSLSPVENGTTVRREWRKTGPQLARPTLRIARGPMFRGVQTKKRRASCPAFWLHSRRVPPVRAANAKDRIRKSRRWYWSSRSYYPPHRGRRCTSLHRDSRLHRYRHRRSPWSQSDYRHDKCRRWCCSLRSS